MDLAERCEDALERGKQLWPIAAHIDYRLALEAPGDYAASVLDPELGRFALAPLTEVVAFAHTFEELAPHIEMPLLAAYVAQERVLRGEDLTGDERAHLEVLEMPPVLLEVEPTYALATFGPDSIEVAEPWEPRAPLEVRRRKSAPEAEDAEVTEALLDLVTPWTNESNGAARAVMVDGDGLAAASAIAMDGIRIGPLTFAEALQRIAWAAASGGAHGRRRGAALGRFMAFHLIALVGDLSWPPSAGELALAADELRFYRWDEGQPEKGWVLRLAIEHPEHGWACAIGATDLVAEEEPNT